MQPETNQPEEYLAPLKKVTPVSKYLAMALFIILPFVGGWIGYSYAPEKVIEVERIVVKETQKQAGVEMDVASNSLRVAEAENLSNLYLPVQVDGVYMVEFDNEVLKFNLSNEYVVFKPDAYTHLFIASKNSPNTFIAELWGERSVDQYGNRLCHLEYCQLPVNGSYAEGKKVWQYRGEARSGVRLDSEMQNIYSVTEKEFNLYLKSGADIRLATDPLHDFFNSIDFVLKP